MSEQSGDFLDEQRINNGGNHDRGGDCVGGTTVVPGRSDNTGGSLHDLPQRVSDGVYTEE